MQRLQENMNNIQSWIQLRFFFTEMQRDMEPEKGPTSCYQCMRTSKIQIAITKDKDCFNIYIYCNSTDLSKIIEVFIHQQT